MGALLEMHPGETEGAKGAAVPHGMPTGEGCGWQPDKGHEVGALAEMHPVEAEGAMAAVVRQGVSSNERCGVLGEMHSGEAVGALAAVVLHEVHRERGQANLQEWDGKASPPLPRD